MSECVVRMEMPKEGCHTCDARCVSALYGYICGIERKNVMPFLGKKNRPDWCPIICHLPEWHGRLVDADALYKKRYIVEPGDILASITVVDACYVSGAQTIVPAERSET